MTIEAVAALRADHALLTAPGSGARAVRVERTERV